MAKAARIALGQHGNITRAQLRTAGLSDEQIDCRVENGYLHRVHIGVYAVGRRPNVPLERAAAAVLACGAQGALAGHSSLALWELEKHWRLPLEVALLSGDRRPPGIVVHRSRSLTRADVTTERGIRTTTPARAILDRAPHLTARRTERLIADARHARILTLEQLEKTLGRAPRHPGARRVTAIVRALAPGGPSRSEFEDAFTAFCRTYGLPVPLLSEPIGGYEVDAYFPLERVIVELDGWDFHQDRLAFESDRERDAAHLACGIVTVRITWDRLQSAPAREAERLHLILEQRRRPIA